MNESETSLDPHDLARLISMKVDATGRIHVEPDRLEKDLARLVLGLMEFLRKLMERQAIRRMENGQLSDEEEDTLGNALMRSEAAIFSLAAQIGLTPEELSLDLGPLGRTF